MADKKKVYVSLQEKQCEQLQKLAEESFRTRSGYIRRIITVYLRQIEEHPERRLK